MEQNKFYQIKNITEDKYTLVGCDGSVTTRPIQEVDKSASAFHIQDAKDGDILIYNDSIFIFDEIYENDLIYYGIYEHNKFHNDKYYSFLDLNTININNIYPATKEQRDTLFKSMKEAGYEWSDKDRKLIKIVE